MYSAQNGGDKTGMLCFHKQRHTVSIQRRLLGFVKAWASLPSRTCYPSSIKYINLFSASLPFWEFFRFQCLCKLFCTKNKVDFSYFASLCLTLNWPNLLFLCRTGKIDWGQKCEITQFENQWIHLWRNMICFIRFHSHQRQRHSNEITFGASFVSTKLNPMVIQSWILVWKDDAGKFSLSSAFWKHGLNNDLSTLFP